MSPRGSDDEWPALETLRRDLHKVVSAGIAAAGAGRLLDRALEQHAEFTHGRTLRVLSTGKAASSMAAAAARQLGSRIHAGLVVSPVPTEIPPAFELIVGGHPLPTAESERAGRQAIALARSVEPDEGFLCLLSGGASALMAVPADGLSLADKQQTTSRLLRGGADISALNTVRKHLSAIKGGWLASSSRGTCQALVVSDVVGNDLGVIGSGPTAADASSFQDALDVLRTFGSLEDYPAAVVARLTAGARGELAETPKPLDPRLSRATSTIIGGRADAMNGARTEAERLGYRVIQIEEAVLGDARHAAHAHMAAVDSRLRDATEAVCVISSGETTVHVKGTGKGGRNQEFVLAAAEALAGLQMPALVASVGTDGIDGPTDAAGAVADTSTLARARAAGLEPERFLQNNDSYAFFESLGDLILIGHTDTNVGDLQIVLAFPGST